MQYLVLSNNTVLPPLLADGIPVRPVVGGVDALYAALGDLLQSGYTLVSAPLPPNVPLIRSPVRSVIVRHSERRYDVEGLSLLEKAKERSATLGVTSEERLLRDLEFIDRDHLLRAIHQLQELLALENAEATPERKTADPHLLHQASA